MKMLLIVLMLASIIGEIHCPARPPPKPRQTKRIGDTINWYTAKQGLINACDGIRSKVGNALVTLKRMANYSSKRFVSWFADRDFILEKNDAAYFFQGEQEVRDQAIAFMEEELSSNREKRDAVRPKFHFMDIFRPWKWFKSFSILGMFRSMWRGFQYMMLNRKIGKMKGEVMAARDMYNPEILCDDPAALERNCRSALDNEKLQDRLSLTFITDSALGPGCEMKPVEVPETGFRSERKFLRCPVEAYNKKRYSKAVMRTYAYISSIENPSVYRMRYYLFLSPELDLSVDRPPEYVFVPQPYPPYPDPNVPPHTGSYPPNYQPQDPRYPPPYTYPPNYMPPHDPQNPPRYVFPTNYVPPYEFPNAPPAMHSTKNSPPRDTKNGSEIIYSPYPATDPLYGGQHAPSAPPQNSSNSLYPTIDSPPHGGGKPPLVPSSPPSPTFEGAKSKSTSPKTEQQKSKKGLPWLSNGSKSKEGPTEEPESPKAEQQKSKKGLSWLSNGSKSKAGPTEEPERPLQIVTLVINKDFRALGKKKQD